MKEGKEDIDKMLFASLAEAEMDGDGIDWASFDKKRKKKRGFIWFWMAASLIVIGICGAYYINHNTLKPIANKPVLETKTPDLQKIETENPIVSESSRAETQSTEFKTVKKQSMVNELTDSDIFEFTRFRDFADSKPLASEKWQDEAMTSLSPLEPLNTKLISFNKFPSYIGDLDKKYKNPKINFHRYKGLFEMGYSSFVFTNSFKVTEAGKAFIHKDYEKIRQLSEHPDGGFDLGVRFGRIYGNFEFLFGISYSRRQLAAQYNFSYSEKPLIDADGRIIGYDYNTPKTIRYDSKLRFNFVETPVIIRYKLKTFANRHTVLLQAGINPQFLKGIRGQLPNPQFLDLKESLSTENFKNSMMGYEIGCLYGIPVTETLRLNIQPYMMFHSGFKQVNAFYADKFNMYGLRASLSMKL